MGDNLDDFAGFILPVAIEPDSWIALHERRDGLVRLASSGSGAGGSFRINALSPETRPSRRSWLDCAAGMAWSMREAALPIHGFDGVVESRIPAWAEPASTATLELAVGSALLGADGLPAPAALASLAQRGQRDYAGLDGTMVSHLAAAAGQAGKAILLDCRSLDHRLVLLPPGLSLIVAAPGVGQGAAASRRNHAAVLRRRRAECGRAVLLLAERMPGLPSLRDLDEAALRRNRRLLPEPLARRAEHVVAENARVLATATALETGDLDALGRHFADAHRSARTRYEIGSPALDAMVDIVRGVRGVVAARMMGSDGGDCTLNLVLDEAVPGAITGIEQTFTARTGLAAQAYPVAVVDGAGLVTAPLSRRR
jgi:galactokinase